MRIVDAQVHIWAANTPERPWPARAEPHRTPLGKEELLAEMDKAGVDGVVIVPPSTPALSISAKSSCFPSGARCGSARAGHGRSGVLAAQMCTCASTIFIVVPLGLS